MAPNPPSGHRLRLAELEASARYASERHRLYRAKTHRPGLTSAGRLRRLERESQLAERRLARAGERDAEG